MITRLTILCASLAVLTLGGSLFAHLGHQHTPVVLELKASEDPFAFAIGDGCFRSCLRPFPKTDGPNEHLPNNNHRPRRFDYLFPWVVVDREFPFEALAYNRMARVGIGNGHRGRLYSSGAKAF